MTVWCHLPTILKRRLALLTAGLITLCVAIITTLFFVIPAHALTGINQTISFQGRLLNASGGIVADGYYNIEFKIYQDGPGTSAGNTGGTLKWTEPRVNNGGTSGVQVKNGYFAVELGSVIPFGSSIDWNQDTLWLSMNVAGSASSCTTFGSGSCVADGEMLPMKRLTAVPYAMQAQNANTLGGMEASALIHNQNTAQQTSSNFWISGTGRADTALQTPVVDTATAGTLTIGGTNATSITMADDVTVAAGKSLTLAGGTTASRPGSPSEGTLWFDTDLKKLIIYADGKWAPLGGGGKTATKIVAASNSPADIKNSADYVADGAGDQVEINAALTAAAGGKVYLAEGTYAITGSISVPNNTTLSGAGNGTLITIADGFDDDIDMIVNTTGGGNGTGIAIQGLKINGNRDNQSDGEVAAIKLVGAGNGSGTSAVPAATITHTNVEETDRAVAIDSSKHITLTNNTWKHNSYGVFTIFSTNVIVSNNQIADGTIRMNAADNNTITGNTMAIGDIVLNGVSNTTVTNNTVRGGGFDGINLYGSSNNTITGNSLAENNRSGIVLDNGSRNNTVSSNAFQWNDTYGVWIGNSSNGNAIVANSFNNNGGDAHNNAIYLDNSDNTDITANSITDEYTDTTNYAINISNSTSNTTHVADNSLGGGSINDSGTGTVYGGQVTSAGDYLVQPAGTIELMKNTNITGNLSASGAVLSPSVDRATAGTLTIGATTATAITMGSASGNVLTTLNGRALIKSTTGNNSTTAFQVQNASSTALLTADTANMQVIIGNGSDTITLSSTGIAFSGNARGTKQIRLAAEYQNTVLDSGATGNNSGTMVSTLDLTNRMNFYRWSASPATAQTYDIVTQVPIPQDFSAWAASNPLSMSSRTDNTADGTMTMELRDSSGTVRCNFTSITMGSANAWITNTPNCLSNTGTTYTPGDYLTIRLRMSAKNGAKVDVGNIALNYLSNK